MIEPRGRWGSPRTIPFSNAWPVSRTSNEHFLAVPFHLNEADGHDSM
jgi:hypothetical protein